MKLLNRWRKPKRDTKELFVHTHKFKYAGKREEYYDEDIDLLYKKFVCPKCGYRKETTFTVTKMETALDYMCYLRKHNLCPASRTKGKEAIAKTGNRATTSELIRWLNEGAFLINGVKPKRDDMIVFPIIELVFFPKNDNTRTTLI